METKQAILNRRSIRQYEERHISEQDLIEILEAGTYAPSGVNYQPWYFVAIQTPKQREKLEAVMRKVAEQQEPSLKERFSKHPEVVEETTRFTRQLGGAPICILAFRLKPEYPKTAETIIQSIAAAIENMLLTATDKGIGSCWLTASVEAGMGIDLQEMFAADKGELVAILTLGYAAKKTKAPPRKDGRFIII